MDRQVESSVNRTMVGGFDVRNGIVPVLELSQSG